MRTADADNTPDARHTLDRLGCAVREVLALVREIADQGFDSGNVPALVSGDAADEGTDRVGLALLALIAGMEHPAPTGRASSGSVAGSSPRKVGRPRAHSGGRVEQARQLRAAGVSLGRIAAQTGIPKTSLHRYLVSTTSEECGSEPASALVAPAATVAPRPAPDAPHVSEDAPQVV